MSETDTSAWKEFRISELFTAVTGDFDIQKKHINNKGNIVITSGNTNNGVLGKSDLDSNVIRENTITVDMFGNCFYRDYEYKMVTHARVFALIPKYKSFDEKSGLYITSLLNKVTGVFGFSNMCSWNKIKDINIKLPTVSSEEIDWNYMQKRIEELEQERIKKLEQERIEELKQYLTATGLDNYELTEEDKNVILLVDSKKSTSHDDAKKYKEFKIENMFGKIETKKINAKKNELPKYKIDAYTIPCRTATAQNQGLSCYIQDNKNITKLKNCISVSANGDYCAFYHDDYFTILQDSYALQGRNRLLSQNEYLYLINSMNKTLSKRYNWSNKSGWNKIKKEYIELPIQTDSDNNPVIDTTYTYHPDGYIPDWDFMEKYIKAIEKVVIADVVKYKDEVIKRTKEIIE